MTPEELALYSQSGAYREWLHAFRGLYSHVAVLEDGKWISCLINGTSNNEIYLCLPAESKCCFSETVFDRGSGRDDAGRQIFPYEKWFKKQCKRSALISKIQAIKLDDLPYHTLRDIHQLMQIKPRKPR